VQQLDEESTEKNVFPGFFAKPRRASASLAPACCAHLSPCADESPAPAGGKTTAGRFIAAGSGSVFPGFFLCAPDLGPGV
jgi:hypothetical protein